MDKEKRIKELEQNVWHKDWQDNYNTEDNELAANILCIIVDYLDGATSERAGNLIGDLHGLLFDKLWDEHCYLGGIRREWELELRKERGTQKEDL